MRIAIVGVKGIPVPISGPENFAEQLATRLVRRGHDVTVYSRPYAVRPWVETFPRPRHLRALDTLDYEGVRIQVLPTVRSKNLDAIVATAIASVHALGRRYDILHYQTLGPSTLSLIPRLFHRAKIITSVHGLDWQRAKWGWAARQYLRFGERTSVWFAHATHVVSLDLKRYYERRYGREVRYIPTGVEILAPRPLSTARRFGLDPDGYILFFSRLVPEKGAHYLIEAYKRLRTTLRLVIGGAALYEERYIARLEEMAGPNVVFTGFVSDDEMAELYSNAYCYVLPSEMEGLPHALLQALAYGRCCVASDIEANREALGECGHTFRSRDPESLAEVLQRLIDRPDLVRAERDKGIARVRRLYDWEVVVGQFEDLYRFVLTRR